MSNRGGGRGHAHNNRDSAQQTQRGGYRASYQELDERTFGSRDQVV